jgi:hypothetical protein
MPAKGKHGHWPPAVAAVLAARGVARAGDGRATGTVSQLPGDAWVIPLPDRAKAAKASRKALKDELTAAASWHKEARRAVKDGALRPVLGRRIEKKETPQ